MKMKNLLGYEFPDSTSRIGYKSLGFTFSPSPTEAIGELGPFATSNLAGRLGGQVQLLNNSLLNIIKVGGTAKLFDYLYHYWGKFGRRWQISHKSNLTSKRSEVNKFPHLALIREYSCQNPIK